MTMCISNILKNSKFLLKTIKTCLRIKFLTIWLIRKFSQTKSKQFLDYVLHYLYKLNWVSLNNRYGELINILIA